MKVLQIGGTFVSAQKIIENGIHGQLIKCGHESHILYAIGDSDDKNIVCYESRLWNLVRRLLTKIFGYNPRFAFASTCRIIRYIKKWKPDIVHLHILHHGYVDYILLLEYLAEKQIPVMFTVHDMWGATGGCYHYTNICCDGYLRGCVGCRADKSRLDCDRSKTAEYFSRKTALYKKLKTPCFVGVSQWVSDELSRTALSAYQIHTIWNSIDEPCGTAAAEKNEKFTVVGVAAYWDNSKGLDKFLKLADLLGDGYRIILVGNAGDEAKAAAPENIVFTGPITDRRKLFELYASSDLHVSMSTEETFGMTFVEAASVGTRSLGFDSTAIPQVIEKTFGYVVAPQDIDAMAAKVRELAADRDGCRLSDGERSSVVKFFSSGRMAQEYLTLYKALLKKD